MYRSLITSLCRHWLRMDRRLGLWLHWPQDLVLLGLRLWLAWIFFKSGLLKFQSWDVTLELFAYEYAVPLLSPTLAAWLATAAELLLPPLLALGLLTRPVVLALLALNAVAALSYPDISPAGIKDHQLWGLAMLWLFLQGAGRLSADAFCQRRSAES
jgi:putative oxidoreductase